MLEAARTLPSVKVCPAESITKHLGCELPLDFVDTELAEPEPGKRYTIGQQLVPELQVRGRSLSSFLKNVS